MAQCIEGLGEPGIDGTVRQLGIEEGSGGIRSGAAGSCFN
jgi:hypothetical protein